MIFLDDEQVRFLSAAWALPGRLPNKCKERSIGLYVTGGDVYGISSRGGEAAVLRGVAPDAVRLHVPAQYVKGFMSIDPSGAVIYADGSAEFPDLTFPADVHLERLQTEGISPEGRWMASDRIAMAMAAFGRAEVLVQQCARSMKFVDDQEREFYVAALVRD